MTDAVYLGLGSNKANRLDYIQKAITLLKDNAIELVAQSSLYETAAWGNTQQAAFLNMVVQVNTTLSPVQLLDLCQQIEKSMGRIRQQKWGARCIDIDILLFGQQHIQVTDLIVPHPRMHERNFVLLPLMEIAANYKHPVLKQTIERIAQKCTDQLAVKRLITDPTSHTDYADS